MRLLFIFSVLLLSGLSVYSLPLPADTAPTVLPLAPQSGDIVTYKTPTVKFNARGKPISSTNSHPAVVLDNGTLHPDGIIHHAIAETSHKLPWHPHRRPEEQYGIEGTGEISMVSKIVPVTSLKNRNGKKVTPENMDLLRAHMKLCKDGVCHNAGCAAGESQESACGPSHLHLARPAKKVGGVRLPTKNRRRKHTTSKRDGKK